MPTFPRSPQDQAGGLYHFPRMTDKIRLHAAGELPPAYVDFLGGGKPTAWDGRVCRFLRVDYAEVTARVLAGATDEELADWAFRTGHQPSEEEKEAFNGFLFKRGWHDDQVENLKADKAASGIADPNVLTYFDLMNAEEGRPVAAVADPVVPLPEVMHPTFIPGVRSPYETVGGVVHLARMIDKIHAHAKGELPEAWRPALGAEKGFDGVCCRFLHIEHPAFARHIGETHGTDEEILHWIHTNGRTPHPEEIEIWNAYMTKRGWRDTHNERLNFRTKEAGLPIGSVLTMFDFIDVDEGRKLRW